MKRKFLTYLIFLLFFSGQNIFAQTYTYNPSKANCTLRWTDGNCWDKVNISGCSNNSASLFPPIVASTNLPAFNDYKNNCIVNVNINHNLSLDPGYDYAFLGPDYRINLGDDIALSTPRSLYLLERSSLSYIKSSGSINAFVNMSNIYYSKQSQFYIGNGLEVETQNIIHPYSSQYEGILFHISPLGVLRVSSTLAFINGNSNKVIVEGLLEVRNLNLDAGNPGFTTSAIDLKNALLIKGTGKSNVCTGINIKGDSYVSVETNGSLNLLTFELAGESLFENWGNVNINAVKISGEPRIKLFAGSQFANQTFTVLSGAPQYFKCGTQVPSITSAVSNCTAGYTVVTDEIFWDGVDGDWCFRTLPIKVSEEKLVYQKDRQVVTLHWTTTKELKNSHFEIERSINSVDDFKKIGEIIGAGFSMDAVSYEFEDNSYPLTGSRLYYRIRQVDYNEDYSFGNVMSVLPINTTVTTSQWYAYPNPNEGKILSVNLGNNNITDPIEFRIFTHFFYSKNYQVSSEGEMNDILAELVSQLPKGVNFLEIKIGDKVEILKLLIKK